MNRELKFRYWNPIAKTYKMSWRYNLTHDGKILAYDVDMMDYDEPTDLENSALVIQQFTGKYDINNNPIYEGDIVELVLAVQTDENRNKIGPEDQFGVYEVFYNERFAAYFLRVHRSNWLDKWFTTEKQAAKLTIDPMCPHLTCLERELGNFNITHVIGNIFENPELLKA